MKKKRIIITLVSIVLVLAITGGIVAGVVSSQSPNREINRCKKYVDKYMDENDLTACLPTDKKTQDEIEKYTTEVITLGSLEGYMHKTNYFGRYILDKTHAKLFFSSDVGVEASYFYKIVILKLKVLLAQGRAKEFEELFLEYGYAIASNFHSASFYEYFISDENYPVEYNDERYIILENALEKMYDELSGVQKYFFLDLMCEFYFNFDKADAKVNECKKLKNELAEVLSDDEIEKEEERRYSTEYVFP